MAITQNMRSGATLELLKTTGVGPAKELECEFAPRLNLITGDNGLGKTFLLECAWWILTGHWANYAPYPQASVAKDLPRIEFQIGAEEELDRLQLVKYNWNKLVWDTPANRSMQPGLSIFAQANGSIAVWDPAKHLSQDDSQKGQSLINFSQSSILNGVREEDQFGRLIRVVCNGLIDDWARWQESADQTRFKELSAALSNLSPDPQKEPLVPGKPTRMAELGDARDIPTLAFPYGEVPILYCSAGIQRIVSLAYVLVWTWQEHVKTAQRMRREPERTIILLIDEMEAHLHPFWQRTILPALLNVVQELAPEVQTQIIITTHSPLVLASVEPLFDTNRDALFHLYLDEDGIVQLDNVPFIKRGRVDKWLISNVFGLTQPRSTQAEEAIEAAKELQRKRTPSKEEVQKVSDRLLNVLAQDDDFWPRWTYFAEQRGASL
jgi:hypothetical protein